MVRLPSVPQKSSQMRSRKRCSWTILQHENSDQSLVPLISNANGLFVPHHVLLFSSNQHVPHTPLTTLHSLMFPDIKYSLHNLIFACIQYTLYFLISSSIQDSLHNPLTLHFPMTPGIKTGLVIITSIFSITSNLFH